MELRKLSASKRVNFHDLPRELLIEIITKQNCVDYLETEECGQIVERCKARMIENSIREFKNKFPLNEKFYQHIHTLNIEKGSNTLSIEFNNADYLSFVEDNNILFCRHHNSNFGVITECVDLFEEITMQNLNDTYEFFINLLDRNRERILELNL